MLYITGDCSVNSPILETLHPRLPGLSRTFPKLGGKCCKKETFIKLLQTSSFFPIRSLDYQPQFPGLHPPNERRADSTERRPDTNERRPFRRRRFGTISDLFGSNQRGYSLVQQSSKIVLKKPANSWYLLVVEAVNILNIAENNALLSYKTWWNIRVVRHGVNIALQKRTDNQNINYLM